MKIACEWCGVRILGDKFCKDANVSFPSVCKACLESIEKFGSKEEKESAFELLNEKL